MYKQKYTIGQTVTWTEEDNNNNSWTVTGKITGLANYTNNATPVYVVDNKYNIPENILL